MTRRATLLALGGVLLASAALSGCGAIFGSRYDNFKAYFNTFYNAERAFAEAEEQVVRDDRPIDRTRYLQVLPQPDAQRGGASGFDDVIEKCARLLRESPDTKYTDDALLLMGKSYFYQGNYEGAKLNLGEAIRVAQEAGRSREEDEARLWLGRALAANGETDEAVDVLREGIDREGAQPRWTSRMRLALAQGYVQDQRWEEAATALADGIERVEDNDLAARAQFLLGQVYEAQERYDQAAEAYGQALRYRPLYELRYAAQLNRALALGLGTGRANEALSLLRRMQRDDNNFANLAELEVAEARVLAAAGRPAAARDLLLALLYENDGQDVGQMRNQALYRLGEVYRDGFEDFSRAAAYLDSAATGLRTPSDRRDALTGQAFLDVDEEADVYLSFAEAAALVAEYDSLLELGSLDDEAFRARLVEIQRARDLAAALDAARQQRLQQQQGFRGGATTGAVARGGARVEQEEGSAAASAAFGTTEDPVGVAGDFGFLAFRNPARVQEAYASFVARWGERPLVPNWRRREAISLAVAGGDFAEDEAIASFAPAAANLGVDVTAVPRTPAAVAEMRAARAAARYEMGNALFLALGRPDSAAAVYRLVIQEDADFDAVERAYYALAEAERALGRGPEADRWYRHVIETYPDSELADQARERLGLAAAAREEPEQDRAETDYALAYATWQQGDYARAYQDLLAISERYPESDVAPRALLAAGRVYMEWAQADSVGLFDPLPQADTLDLSGLYGRLSEQYAGTPYASRAQALQAALEAERPTPPAPDTLARDALAADSLAYPADSLAFSDGPGGASADTLQEGSALADTTREATLDEARPLADEVSGAPELLREGAREREAPTPPADAPAGRRRLLEEEIENERTTSAPSQEAPAAASNVDALLQNRAPIRPEVGGVTWVVGTFEQRPEAEEVLRALVREGYQAALIRRSQADAPFLVTVGQFASEAAAAAVLPALQAITLEGVQPYQLGLSGVEVVVQGADLRGAPGR